MCGASQGRTPRPHETATDRPATNFEAHGAFFHPVGDDATTGDLAIDAGCAPFWHDPAARASVTLGVARAWVRLRRSTGHASRLAREGIVKSDGFGNHLYSKEELVAEMTAAVLCGITGIDGAGLIG